MRIDLTQPTGIRTGRERAGTPYDVCIVGSGPAGTTVARELAGRGLRVCVLESGNVRRTRHADALKEVRSEGIRIKEYSRERVLGGASSTWAGLSSPFDPIDFEHRPWVPHAAWPFEREVLLPYYERAALGYRFPAAQAFGPDGFEKLAPADEQRPRWERIDEKVFLACEEPQHFGREFADLWERDDTDLLLEATVVRLESNPEGTRVKAALVRTSRGEKLSIQARAFVLAAGGIENPRLLLLSEDAAGIGLGNRRDQVGRYLMNHPKNYHGVLHLTKPVESLPYYFGCLYGGFAGYAGLRLHEQEQRAKRVLNSYVRFEPLFPWSDNQGVESLVLLVKRTSVLLRAFRKRRRGEVIDLRDYSETGDDSDLQNQRKGLFGWLGVLWNVVRHAPSVLAYAYYRLSRARPKVRRVRLRNFLEMEPRPENRVELAEQRDINGCRLPLVRHHLSELDQRSLVELHGVLVKELAATGLGRLETKLAVGPGWPIDQDASHHMGTTRMGNDPESSVTDADARVHGVDNLWIAGASVLPTAGCANPTFTLVALAIRLADHLKERLAEPSPAPEVSSSTPTGEFP